MSESGESSCRRIQKDDWVTLDALLRTYSDRLVRFAYSYVNDSAVAEDLAEDAFATLIFKGGRFDSENQLRSYLYKVTRNRCIDYLRRHRHEVPLADVENVLHSENAEQTVFRKQRDETLYVCMQALPRQYREVLQLCYFDGFSLQQAAAILKKTMKQVYNLHDRAKTALRELLIKEGISHEDL